MTNDVYEKLRVRLDAFPTAMPSTAEGTEIALLKKLFTEEEAETASQLPLMMEGLPKESRVVAREMGKEPEQVERLLDAMVQKGLLFMVDLGGGKGYALLPFTPGILEFNVDRIDAETAMLFEKYHKKYMLTMVESNKIPMTKVVPINRSLSSETQVHPYEDVLAAIENSTSLCLLDCMCRIQKKMIGEDCGRPIETCLYMNEYADHLLQIGKGRPVTKEEAVEVLNKAEDAGLIHISNNAQGLQGLCSCCGCCCMDLQVLTKMKTPEIIAKSDFKLAVNPELCTGCELCIDRCWSEALSLEDEKILVDRNRCIGCGSCAYMCPTEALCMERKPDDEVEPIPRDFEELLTEMGWRG